MKMNFFSSFFQSLYSPKMIARMRFQKIGKTILYVFFLSFLAFLPNAIHFSTGVIGGLKGLEETAASELPPFTIKNGKLSSELKEPFETKKGDFIIVFDSQNVVTKEELQLRENALGFLTNEFVFVSDGNIQTFDYSMLQTSLLKEDILNMLKQINDLILIILSVLFFLLFLASSFAKFIEITILSIIAILFKNKLNKKLNFKQLWTISTYTVTLATVFFMIMDIFKVIVPIGFYINWFVHLIILFLVLKEIPSPKHIEN